MCMDVTYKKYLKWPINVETSDRVLICLNKSRIRYLLYLFVGVCIVVLEDRILSPRITFFSPFDPMVHLSAFARASKLQSNIPSQHGLKQLRSCWRWNCFSRPLLFRLNKCQEFSAILDMIDNFGQESNHVAAFISWWLKVPIQTFQCVPFLVNTIHVCVCVWARAWTYQSDSDDFLTRCVSGVSLLISPSTVSSAAFYSSLSVSNLMARLQLQD